MMKRQEINTTKEEKNKALKRGKEFYLQKVTNFLITSFCLNLATELIFTYALLHDYINSYLNNSASVGIFEGNNWCFLLFYSFRTIGYWISAFYFSQQIQKDVDSCGDLGGERKKNHHDLPDSYSIQLVLEHSNSRFTEFLLFQLILLCNTRFDYR